MTPLLYDDLHWRRRAEEMRRIASRMGPLERARDALLRIAEEYDLLAIRAAERTDRKDDRTPREARSPVTS